MTSLIEVHAGDQHDHAVHADAQPAGGRHAVLERAQVVLVDGRGGLVVAEVLGRLLVLEAQRAARPGSFSSL